jgi:superoxide dismutase, Fe-Mn family
MYNFIKEVILNEVKSTADQDRLIQLQLRYAKGDLDPVISEDTINYHYGKLYKSYVDRYNKGEGDPDFNEAGAFLHRIYFDQFQSPTGSNTPEGLSLELILKHYDDFEDFKSQVEKTAMTIQGSGWVYLARNGQIKTIKNHQIRSDIVLLIDWWEHAWALDYQSDKLKYLSNTWRIIDWRVINSRLTVDLNQ